MEVTDHYVFTERDEVHRDLAGFSELRLEREHNVSTVCTPTPAKCEANVTELARSMAVVAAEHERARIAASLSWSDDALPSADAHEAEGATG